MSVAGSRLWRGRRLEGTVPAPAARLPRLFGRVCGHTRHLSGMASEGKRRLEAVSFGDVGSACTSADELSGPDADVD